MKLLEKNKEFETVEIYVCTICGNIEFAPLPDICPVCDHDKKFFKKIE
ncbi:MAG: rubredoxin-like domain-containing protein [Promethearchaeota archaeon]